MRCRYPIQASLLFLASSGLQLAACASEEPLGGGTSTVSTVAGTSAPTAAAGTSAGAAGRAATPAAGTSAPVAGASTPTGAAGVTAAGSSAAGTTAAAAGTGVTGASGSLASAGAPGPGSAGTSAAGTSAAGTSAAGGAGGGSAGTATYQQVFEEVFVAGSCGVAACHASAQGPSKLGLSDPDAAYTELVGVKAMADCASSGVLRVKAGDPDNSLLLQKLEDKQSCGAPMPPNGLLDAAQVQLVRSWILAGAKK